jgi:hypothetical protein
MLNKVAFGPQICSTGYRYVPQKYAAAFSYVNERHADLTAQSQLLSQ